MIGTYEKFVLEVIIDGNFEECSNEDNINSNKYYFPYFLTPLIIEIFVIFLVFKIFLIKWGPFDNMSCSLKCFLVMKLVNLIAEVISLCATSFLKNRIDLILDLLERETSVLGW